MRGEGRAGSMKGGASWRVRSFWGGQGVSERGGDLVLSARLDNVLCGVGPPVDTLSVWKYQTHLLVGEDKKREAEGEGSLLEAKSAQVRWGLFQGAMKRGHSRNMQLKLDSASHSSKGGQARPIQLKERGAERPTLVKGEGAGAGAGGDRP